MEREKEENRKEVEKVKVNERWCLEFERRDLRTLCRDGRRDETKDSRADIERGQEQ